MEGLLSGDVALLEHAIGNGLSTSMLWPSWDFPIASALSMLCPPNTAQMLRLLSGIGAPLDDLGDPRGVPALLASGHFLDADPASRLDAVSLVWQAMPVTSQKEFQRLLSACGFAAAVPVLSALGADWSGHFMDGSTPLHVAYRHGQAMFAAALLSAGVDREVLDRNGHTPRIHCDLLGGTVSGLPMAEFIALVDRCMAGEKIPDPDLELPVAPGLPEAVPAYLEGEIPF